ncbi:MAG TPA: hypothetical protein DIT49_02335 [Clostridiales bacterium]|nr:hypothetical protein [Clostridiales bacterium]
MRDSISLGEYLYHALRTRITSGLLEAGSPFLSIQQLREEYQVGFRTAREVTQRLQEEGLIAVRPRHTPTIAYSLTGAARQTALAQAAAQRDALLEVCDTLTLVLPLFLSGAGGIPPAVPPAQWEEMTRAVGRGLEAGEWRTLVQRFAQALRTTGTPLFHSVFIALLSSSRPGLFLGEGRAYTAFSQRIRQVLTGAMACNLPQEGQSLRAVLHSYRELVERSLPPQTAPGCTGPLFLWQLPHLPDYRYRRLVHHLLQDISSGRYPPGSFLPHEGALARSHGLSVSTVRRAMALLRELGFCRTLNARGTQVLPRDQAEAIPALSAPSARQMVYTALQASQLLLLLLESITHLSLPHVTQTDRDALSHALTQGEQAMPLITQLLLERLPLSPLRHIGTQLFHAVQWGSYLCLPQATHQAPLHGPALSALFTGDCLCLGQALCAHYHHTAQRIRQLAAPPLSPGAT